MSTHMRTPLSASVRNAAYEAFTKACRPPNARRLGSRRTPALSVTFRSLHSRRLASTISASKASGTPPSPLPGKGQSSSSTISASEASGTPPTPLPSKSSSSTISASAASSTRPPPLPKTGSPSTISASEASGTPPTPLPGTGSSSTISASEASGTPPHPLPGQPGQNASSHSDLRSQLPSSQPPPPRSRRRFAPILYGTLFLMLGLTAGQYTRYVVAPPPLPAPHTPEDRALKAFLITQASKLAVVRQLETSPGFVSWDAYSSIQGEARDQRMTTGVLGGSSGFGAFQRVWLDPATGDMLSVVWLGGGMSGWPGITHGGALATLLDESLGRCAIHAMNKGLVGKDRKSGVTAHLELRYKKPTVTNSFVVVRCRPAESLEGRQNKEGKQWVTGRIESVDGVTLVEAEGLFVWPRGIQLKPLGEGF